MRKFSIVFLCGLAALATGRAQEPLALQLDQTILMPDVEGRIDHFAVDLKHKRLFVAALGNNTVEVLDLAAGRRIASIPNLSEPQGLLYLPDSDRLFVANGGDGTVRIFGGLSLRPLASVKLSGDADNIRYDAGEQRVWVGYGNGALGVLDQATGARLGDVPLDAHPESFQLETGGPRIFVNVPKAGYIAVVDRVKRAVTARWRLSSVGGNFPMALDEKNHLLFVGCRKPAEVLVLDTETGDHVGAFEINEDTDDLFYDANRKRVYVSCGDGYVDVFTQRTPREYERIARIPTMPGARTSLFVPDFERLYVALPAHPNHSAEIRVYRVQP